MNCSKFLILTFFSFLCTTNIVNGYLGINWGRLASQRMVPSMVVDMLLQNGIKEVKLFSTSKNVLQAFVDTDIGITVTIPNEDLLKLNDSNAATNWVQENIVPFVLKNVKIRYVFILFCYYRLDIRLY